MEMEQDHPVKDRAQVEVWGWAAEAVGAGCLPVRQAGVVRVPAPDREEVAFAQVVEQR